MFVNLCIIYPIQYKLQFLHLKIIFALKYEKLKGNQQIFNYFCLIGKFWFNWNVKDWKVLL